MKRFLPFITQGLEVDFDFQIRRSRTPDAFFDVCEEFLSNDTPIPVLPPERSNLFCGFGELLGAE